MVRVERVYMRGRYMRVGTNYKLTCRIDMAQLASNYSVCTHLTPSHSPLLPLTPLPAPLLPRTPLSSPYLVCTPLIPSPR